MSFVACFFLNSLPMYMHVTTRTISNNVPSFPGISRGSGAGFRIILLNFIFLGIFHRRLSPTIDTAVTDGVRKYNKACMKAPSLCCGRYNPSIPTRLYGFDSRQPGFYSRPHGFNSRPVQGFESLSKGCGLGLWFCLSQWPWHSTDRRFREARSCVSVLVFWSVVYVPSTGIWSTISY